MRRSAAWLLTLLLACGCSRSEARLNCDVDPAKLGPIELRQLSARFANDALWRRECLEESLVNRSNGYAKARLEHYQPEAWGRLPLLAFATRPVIPSDLGKPIPSPDGSWTSVPSGDFPAGREGLRLRGEQMFTRFAAQIERSMIPILRDPDGPSRHGLWQTSDSVGGLVWIALPGGVLPALTCSSCHSSIDAGGRLRHGLPNHQFDLGRAKDSYMNQRSLYSTWGPGRVDIAADGRDNPIVIADVRAVRYQRYLHRTANVKNTFVALALRVETGLVTAHNGAVRPKCEDALALAYYLWSLGDAFDTTAATHHRGRRVFEQNCAKCHQGQAHAGEPVTAEAIDSPVAQMPSAARGTGKLQSVSLLGVSERKRLLFGGEALGLSQLMDPARDTGGHYFGRDLDDRTRAAIIDYLESL